MTLRVTNTGTRDVYLAVMGRGCTDFAIDGIDGAPVPLGVLGESPAATDPDWGYADTFRRLAPGATSETNWFGKRTVADGCIGEECLVDPGSFRVTFGYELSPPPGCASDAEKPDLWYCPTRPGLQGNPIYAPLCPTSRTTTQEFVVPPLQVGEDAGTAIIVTVPLNPGQ